MSRKTPWTGHLCLNLKANKRSELNPEPSCCQRTERLSPSQSFPVFSVNPPSSDRLSKAKLAESVVDVTAQRKRERNLPPSITAVCFPALPLEDATPPGGELVFASRRNKRFKLYEASAPQPRRALPRALPWGFGARCGALSSWLQLQASEEAPLHHSPPPAVGSRPSGGGGGALGFGCVQRLH